MQIKEIIIYSNQGQIRRVPLNLGKVNIITGKSMSGKTAIGEIIDYCLGEGSCNIAEGVVRNYSSWFALLLQFNKEQIFVARQNPPSNQQSTNHCYIEFGTKIKIPLEKDLLPNTNTAGVIETISRKLGIFENLHIPKEGQTRPPLEANLRHALFYCFQNQYEIASPKILFHKQQEDFVTQAIKDTLPYFLGVVNENVLSLENERTDLRRQLIRENRRLEEQLMLRGGGLDRAITLLSEAKNVGLVSDNLVVDNDDFDAVYKALHDISSWEPLDVNSVSPDRLTLLQEELQRKGAELNTLNDDIDSANKYISGVNDYSSANSQQVQRLISIGLFEQLDFRMNKCPLCSGELGDNSLPTAEKIKQAIHDLSKNIDVVEREKPRIQKHIADLKISRDKLRNAIYNIRLQIDAEYAQQATALQIKDLNSRRAHVVGRISLWLDSVRKSDNLDGKKDTITRIESRLNEIEELLDRNAIEERKASLLRRISVNMTEWARELHLEHSDSPFSLDMSKVTVIIDKPKRPVPLAQLGGGTNWVGVHLLAYFALHQYFITADRPVPRFIFIDQPSQVYFPSDQEGKSRDWERVKHIYRFIIKRVKELNHSLQLIIVDHADFKEEKDFQNSVIEDWHKEEDNLIPIEWYKTN
jgi:hypothetical protein